VLLHGCVELLRQVITHVRHAGLLLVGTADAAFILVGLLVVLFLGILAVTLTSLQSCKAVRLIHSCKVVGLQGAQPKSESHQADCTCAWVTYCLQKKG
jgi:prenyltransferase beta subunit